jgi:predicted transcriptional regulator
MSPKEKRLLELINDAEPKNYQEIKDKVQMIWIPSDL